MSSASRQPRELRLRLCSFDNIVDDLIDRRPPTRRFGTLVVVPFPAHSLPLEEDPVVVLFDDLDIDGELQSTPRGDGLRWVRAHRDRDVDVVGDDRTADDRVGTTLRGIAHSQPALQLAMHGVQQLALNFRRRRLILERHHRHGPDIGWQSSTGEAVVNAKATADRQQNDEKTRTDPKSQHRRLEPLERA